MPDIAKEMVYKWLREVKDPELPVLSLVDLGVITDVTVSGRHVTVGLTPTFVGCPALDTMKQEIEQLLLSKGISTVEINVSFKQPWNSDMISEEGRKALQSFGIAPPPKRVLFADLDVLEAAICPRCNSANTTLRNTFGSTLCRAIYYCNDCREAFEQFKPL